MASVRRKKSVIVGAKALKEWVPDVEEVVIGERKDGMKKSVRWSNGLKRDKN